GLGSSSCYLVGLLNALHTLSRKPTSRQQLAEEACHIELDVLRKPIGKQDQYLAAFGGITALHIAPDGAVEVESLTPSPQCLRSGLGSSSCYLVGLLNALHTVSRKPTSRQQLAEEACHIELDVLRKPIGKQDQYLAAFGGITALHIAPDGAVEVESLTPSPQCLEDLESRVLLFYTGLSRSTEEILAEQPRDLQQDASAVATYYSQI